MRHCLVMLFSATLGSMFATVLHLQQLVFGHNFHSLFIVKKFGGITDSFLPVFKLFSSLWIVRKEHVSLHSIVCVTLKTCAEFCNRGNECISVQKSPSCHLHHEIVTQPCSPCQRVHKVSHLPSGKQVQK